MNTLPLKVWAKTSFSMGQKNRTGKAETSSSTHSYLALGDSHSMMAVQMLSSKFPTNNGLLTSGYLWCCPCCLVLPLSPSNTPKHIRISPSGYDHPKVSKHCIHFSNGFIHIPVLITRNLPFSKRKYIHKLWILDYWRVYIDIYTPRTLT